MASDNDVLKERLKNQLKYTFSKSDFYKARMRKAGLRLRDISAHVQLFPLTTKNDVLIDQEQYPPFGSNLCVNIDRVKRIHKTSGTTDRPVLIALTENDIKKTVEIGSLCFRRAGLKPTDIVIHCLNYSIWAGGYTDHQSLEGTGAAVIPFGIGNSKNLIATILWIQPTAIHCTPSYLSNLEVILRQDFNLSPRDLKLKLGLFGAEPGLQNPDYRRNLEKVWGFKAMNANYGISEVISMCASESVHQDGLFFTARKYIYPELKSLQGNEILPFDKGAVGELVLTNLSKEAQPLIRYRTNDVIKIISAKSKKGINKGFGFEVVGRSDDMIVVKGINLFIGSLEAIINKQLHILTGAYQVLVNKSDPIDRLLIKMEIKHHSDLKKENLKQRLLDDFKTNLGVLPEIELLDADTLPRVEGKSKRLFRIL